MRKMLFISLLFCSLVINSEILFPGIIGEDLIDSIIANYKSYSNLGYDDGRDVLYGTIDNDNDYLTGVYSGYTIYLDPSADPSSDAYNKGINCEHTWPQSLGASGLAKGDLHHLYPTREESNSARGSLPFDEIDDKISRVGRSGQASLGKTDQPSVERRNAAQHASQTESCPPAVGAK